MDNAIMTIIVGALGIVLGGVRLMYCGHRHRVQSDRRDPASPADRRRRQRGADRRAT